jgi:hypothetical protein
MGGGPTTHDCAGWIGAAVVGSPFWLTFSNFGFCMCSPFMKDQETPHRGVTPQPRQRRSPSGECSPPDSLRLGSLYIASYAAFTINTISLPSPKCKRLIAVSRNFPFFNPGFMPGVPDTPSTYLPAHQAARVCPVQQLSFLIAAASSPFNLKIRGRRRPDARRITTAMPLPGPRPNPAYGEGTGGVIDDRPGQFGGQKPYFLPCCVT